MNEIEFQPPLDVCIKEQQETGQKIRDLILSEKEKGFYPTYVQLDGNVYFCFHNRDQNRFRGVIKLNHPDKEIHEY